MKVNGKVVVVTGAGSGIGREVALEALRRGALVAAVDRDPAGLDGTAELAASPTRLSTHVLDITDRAAVEALPAAGSCRCPARRCTGRPRRRSSSSPRGCTPSAGARRCG